MSGVRSGVYKLYHWHAWPILKELAELSPLVSLEQCVPSRYLHASPYSLRVLLKRCVFSPFPISRVIWTIIMGTFISCAWRSFTSKESYSNFSWSRILVELLAFASHKICTVIDVYIFPILLHNSYPLPIQPQGEISKITTTRYRSTLDVPHHRRLVQETHSKINNVKFVIS